MADSGGAPATGSGGDAGGGSNTGTLSLRGAIFIGIGAMVGAGIFALFGEAGTIAGAAVWVSFLIGGIIALLQGYSFAKLGARYPSRGGMISWLVRGFGPGLFSGGVVVLGYFSVILVTAMVAVSFGNYATSLFLGADAAAIWVNIFASLVVVVLTIVNIVGRRSGVEGTDGDRIRRPGYPGRVRHRHAHADRPVTSGPGRLSPGPRHRLERGPDLLRLSGLRGHRLRGRRPEGRQEGTFPEPSTSPWGSS